MAQLLESDRAGNILRLTRRQRRAGVILLVAYVATSWLANHFSLNPGTLTLSSGLALSALFLEGIQLWPIVYVASLLSTILHGTNPMFWLIVPVAQTLQAVAGAYLLRAVKIDPLFRRYSDAAWLLIIIFLISMIVPLGGSLAEYLTMSVYHTTYLMATWGARFVATVFSLLIVSPFLLRWFAKPRFNRNWKEILELFIIFAILITLDVLLFIHGITVFHAIPLIYLLMIPLFWVALRLRPRFVTLAMLVTSGFAVYGVFIHQTAAAAFTQELVQIEALLIVLSSIFLIIVSLEEDRRLNSNLMRSQLATLQNAVARVSSESRAKNDFIAVLAHELRNPLAPVVSGIDFLKINERSIEELEMLNMMEERMQTVRRLLDDLLDISRISEGKLALNKELVNLDAVLRNALISTQHYLKERHQPLTVRTPEKSIIVEGDAVRLEQVFSNLITNASKYSNSGDTISISIQPQGELVAIEVTDEGVGIPQDALKDIFAPFHQIEMGVRTKQGLGIGLALVKSFIEMHDGTITAHSDGLGKGSIFTILLPIATASSHTMVQRKAGPQLQEGVALIVNDSDAAAWDLGKQLELRRWNVAYAYDAEQAVQQVYEVEPSLVLLDLKLPDKDGYALAEEMRALGYAGKLIALTDNDGQKMRRRVLEAGCDAVLIRPITITDLEQAIPRLS